MNYFKLICCLFIIICFINMINHTIENYPDEDQYIVCQGEYLNMNNKYMIHKNNIKQIKPNFMNQILKNNNLIKDNNKYYGVPLCDSIYKEPNKKLVPVESNADVYDEFHKFDTNNDLIITKGEYNKIYQEDNISDMNLQEFSKISSVGFNPFSHTKYDNSDTLLYSNDINKDFISSHDNYIYTDSKKQKYITQNNYNIIQDNDYDGIDDMIDLDDDNDGIRDDKDNDDDNNNDNRDIFLLHY
jgi:hypothetical protein